AQGKGNVAGRLKSFLRAFFQAVADDAFQFPRYGLTDTGDRRWVVMENRRQSFRPGPAPKGSVAGYHFVKHTAQGKNVAAGIGGQAIDLFRRHVRDRTVDGDWSGSRGNIRPGIRGSGGRFPAGQAEVENLKLAGGGQKDVFRLEITV